MQKNVTTYFLELDAARMMHPKGDIARLFANVWVRNTSGGNGPALGFPCDLVRFPIICGREVVAMRIFR